MKYKYCVICRGEDDLMRCIQCSKAYHCECVNLKEIVKNYVCEECSGDATEYITTAKRSKTDTIIGKWSSKMWMARAAYLKSISPLLEPFNTDGSLQKIIKAKPEHKGNIIETRVLNETPQYLVNVTMRKYQLEGTSKLISWFGRGVGGILADEMGLGKTLQTIALLSYLKEELDLSGPHLVVTPLAVLQNWANEFARFAPQTTFKKIHGSAAERDQLMTNEDVLGCKFDVYLTTYETLVGEEGFFTDSWKWATITIDEGHRIKNENAALRRALNRLKCPFRLLLTGTPLQNNLHELWALLNYLIPDIFKDSTLFDTGADVTNDTMNQDTCKKARVLLEHCFMIRREKKNVETSLRPKIFTKLYVQMTDLQRRWYRSVLSINDPRNLDSTLSGSISLLTNTQLQHILSQLQKVVNHPKQILLKREADRHKENNRVLNAAYSGSEFIKPRTDLLAPDKNSPAYAAEEELRALRGEALIKSSGKLAVLDRLLRRLKEQGSRVLLFSQYTETLDILEEYMNFRFGPKGVIYLRLDGQVNRVIRELDVRKFNAPGSKIFVYLISTRAGGQGINLATANSVILYDTAWNPQIDLQAQDRAHRIGQTQQVTVYRLLVADSFEERVMEIAERKLLLDHLVISQKDGMTTTTDDLSGDRAVRRLKRASGGRSKVNEDELNLSMSETWAVLRHGTEKIFKTDGVASTAEMTESELDAFLDSCVMDSGGNALPSVSKQSKSDMEQIMEELEELEKDGRGSSADPVPIPIDMSGVRTIFDLEEPSTAVAAAHVDGTSGGEGEVSGDAVGLKDEVDEGNDDDDDSERHEIETSSSSAVTVQPAAVDTGVEGRSSTMDDTGGAPPSMSEEGNSMRWEDEEVKRFPKRQRLAVKKYVPTLSVSVSKPKKKKVHESECFCCDDGGDLIECAICPKVYHLECVGLKSVPKGYWQCHWHSCYTCLRSSSNSGGVQFRCVDCPLAYCFDCFPKHIELKTLDPLPAYFTSKYLKSGFELSPNSLHFRCNECTTDMVERVQKEERERQRTLKWATVKSHLQKKLNQATTDIYRQMSQNRSIQEAQIREMDKIKSIVIALRDLVAPEVACTRTSEQQLKDRSNLEMNVKRYYLAQENMAKIRSQYESLAMKLRAAQKTYREELQQVDEQMIAENVAEEAAEREEKKAGEEESIEDTACENDDEDSDAGKDFV